MTTIRVQVPATSANCGPGFDCLGLALNLYNIFEFTPDANATSFSYTFHGYGADILEKEYQRRPVIFLTNGFETRIIDNQYPERKVSSIYSKRDLEKYFNLINTRGHLRFISVNKNIAGRYYQEEAIKAVCEDFDQKNRRKSLLVMATGSGKTRTVIGLVDVLLQEGWIKNVLFLADRNSLVTQAKRSFVNMLPELSATNLVEDKENYNAHAVFSTYQTMM